ncbi:MAG: hypothetical protein ACRETB_13910 [Steroidobacteraceae bacterium]
MPRLGLALLLPLFLVIAEQGAMLHKLSHTYYSGRALAAQMSDDSGLIDNNDCPACRAFGQIANPVGSAATLPVVKPSTYLPIPAPAYHVATADTPTHRSRGPPRA